MLQPDFLDWWFAPWRYARPPRPALPSDTDLLGQRAGYRLWCRSTQLAPDLPARFDPEWQCAASETEDELLATAELFAGLLAARVHDSATLGQLPLADRAWCARIAATQPMQRADGEALQQASLQSRGLFELARRLEAGFPGMWPRLQLLLTAPIAGEVERLLRALPQAGVSLERNPGRAPRCWELCRRRRSVTAGTDELSAAAA